MLKQHKIKVTDLMNPKPNQKFYVKGTNIEVILYGISSSIQNGRTVYELDCGFDIQSSINNMYRLKHYVRDLKVSTSYPLSTVGCRGYITNIDFITTFPVPNTPLGKVLYE